MQASLEGVNHEGTDRVSSRWAKVTDRGISLSCSLCFSCSRAQKRMTQCTQQRLSFPRSHALLTAKVKSKIRSEKSSHVPSTANSGALSPCAWSACGSGRVSCDARLPTSDYARNQPLARERHATSWSSSTLDTWVRPRFSSSTSLSRVRKDPGPAVPRRM